MPNGWRYVGKLICTSVCFNFEETFHFSWGKGITYWNFLQKAYLLSLALVHPNAHTSFLWFCKLTKLPATAQVCSFSLKRCSNLILPLFLPGGKMILPVLCHYFTCFILIIELVLDFITLFTCTKCPMQNLICRQYIYASIHAQQEPLCARPGPYTLQELSCVATLFFFIPGRQTDQIFDLMLPHFCVNWKMPTKAGDFFTKLMHVFPLS